MEMKKFQFVIAYDVRDDKIRNKIFRMLRGYGIHAEKSVFECYMTITKLEHLKQDLISLLEAEADTLKIYRLTATKAHAIFSFGKVLDVAPTEEFLIF